MSNAKNAPAAGAMLIDYQCTLLNKAYAPSSVIAMPTALRDISLPSKAHRFSPDEY